jgi:hypothetical protein
VTKDRWIEKDVQMYRRLLVHVLADGVVSPHERVVLQRYRKIHYIEPSIHDELLASLGWTPEQYAKGEGPASPEFLARQGRHSEESSDRSESSGPYSSLARRILPRVGSQETRKVMQHALLAVAHQEDPRAVRGLHSDGHLFGLTSRPMVLSNEPSDADLEPPAKAHSPPSSPPASPPPSPAPRATGSHSR